MRIRTIRNTSTAREKKKKRLHCTATKGDARVIYTKKPHVTRARLQQPVAKSFGGDVCHGRIGAYLWAHAERADVLHRRGLELRLPGLEIGAQHVARVFLKVRGRDD